MRGEYIGINQFGDKYDLKGFTLKILKEKTGYKNAKLMFIDTKEGYIKKVGYVLTNRGYPQLWVRVFRLADFKTGELI